MSKSRSVIFFLRLILSIQIIQIIGLRTQIPIRLEKKQSMVCKYIYSQKRVHSTEIKIRIFFLLKK